MGSMAPLLVKKSYVVKSSENIYTLPLACSISVLCVLHSQNIEARRVFFFVSIYI